MAIDKELIKCVILTLRKENVIVPNALVAEIISVKDVRTTADAPTWHLGHLNWRGADIPLLSFEAAGGATISKVNLNTQAVVLYGVGAGEVVGAVPYLALVMSGVPHVSHFSREQIRKDSEEVIHPMVAQNIRINGARVSILDIDAMVNMVRDIDIAA